MTYLTSQDCEQIEKFLEVYNKLDEIEDIEVFNSYYTIAEDMLEDILLSMDCETLDCILEYSYEGEYSRHGFDSRRYRDYLIREVMDGNICYFLTQSIMEDMQEYRKNKRRLSKCMI